MGKKQKDHDHDATREVLLWASENDLQETISAVLSVRKEHKYRGHSKEMYQVLLAEHPDRNIPSRLLVLKNDRVDKFEVQHKHCFEMKEIHTVEVAKDDGLQILTIRGSGDRKSKWSCTSSSDLLHLVLSLRDEYAKETGGKKLAVSGIESSSVISRRRSDEDDDDDDKAEDDAAANAAPNDKEDETHGAASGDIAMTRIEEDNLREMMKLHHVGLEDLSTFRDQLRQEESLLEEANIHAAIAGDDLVYSLLSRLREAQNEAASVLQHVGSWRQSLSVARIDVDLVEQSSKKLETATQNQEKLGAYVKEMISGVRIGKSHVNALQEGLKFAGDGSLDPAVEAATGRLVEVYTNPVWNDAMLSGMEVVQMSHKEVQNARLKFVGHVLDRFKAELRSFLDSSQGWQPGGSGGILGLGNLHRKLRSGYATVIQALPKLDRNAVVAVREEYVSAIAPVVSKRVKLVIEAGRRGAVKGRKSGDNNFLSLPEFEASQSALRAEGDASLRWIGPLMDDLVTAASDEEGLWSSMFGSGGDAEEPLSRARSRGGDDFLERTLSSFLAETQAVIDAIVRPDGSAAISVLCQIEGAQQRLPSNPPPRYGKKLIAQLLGGTRALLEKYVESQIQHVKDSKSGVKRVGVTNVVQRLPTQIHRLLQSLLNGPAQPRSADQLAKSTRSLVDAALQWLIDTAAHDPKHRDVFLFENTSRLCRNLRELNVSWDAAEAQVGDGITSSLMQGLDRALEIRDSSLKNHVSHLVKEHAGKVLSLSEAIEQCINTRGADRVKSTAGLSLSVVQASVKEQLGSPEKLAKEMHKRMMKNISKQEGMAPEVWGNVIDVLVSCYQRLCDHVMAVYGVALEPPVAALSHAMSAPAYSFHD